MYHSVTPHTQLLQFLPFGPRLVFFNGLNFLNHLNRFELILLLPAPPRER